jgi:hypothetical protein
VVADLRGAAIYSKSYPAASNNVSFVIADRAEQPAMTPESSSIVQAPVLDEPCV